MCLCVQLTRGQLKWLVLCVQFPVLKCELLVHVSLFLLSSQVPGDCMVALGFSMHELSLLHLQSHMQQQPGVAPHLVEELFLGDVPTEWAERQHCRPTGYQCPLQSALVSMEPCGDALAPAQQVL